LWWTNQRDQDQMHPGLEIIHSMLYSLLSQCIFTMFIFCSNCHITRFERPFVIIWTIKFVFARSPLITKTLRRKSNDWLVRKNIVNMHCDSKLYNILCIISKPGCIWSWYQSTELLTHKISLLTMRVNYISKNSSSICLFCIFFWRTHRDNWNLRKSQKH
jgi:hypothetical protein